MLWQCYGPPVVHPAYLPPRALTPIDRNSANQVRRDHCSRMWQKTGPGSNIHYWPPIILLVAADRHNNTESDGRGGNGGGNTTPRVAIPIQSTQGHKDCQFINTSVNRIPRRTLYVRAFDGSPSTHNPYCNQKCMLDKISRMFLEHAHLVYEGRNTSPRDNIMTQLTLSLNRCKYGKTDIIDCYRLPFPKISPRFLQDFPKISSRFPQDFFKISPRFPQDFPEISLGFPQNAWFSKI